MSTIYIMGVLLFVLSALIYDFCDYTSLSPSERRYTGCLEDFIAAVSAVTFGALLWPLLVPIMAGLWLYKKIKNKKNTTC